jgi:hypothetical protein
VVSKKLVDIVAKEPIVIKTFKTTRTMKFILEIIGTTIFVLVEIYVLGIIYWATKKQHLKNENNERSN